MNSPNLAFQFLTGRSPLATRLPQRSATRRARTTIWLRPWIIAGRSAQRAAATRSAQASGRREEAVP